MYFKAKYNFTNKNIIRILNFALYIQCFTFPKNHEEIIAMETMSAMPIEDKVAMSMVVVLRKGITGIRAGEEVIPVKDNQ